MDETDPLYQYVRTVMVEIMAVLWANGQTQLHVGAMMRLLGVPEESASKHDEERIEIDENFAQLASELNIKYLIQSRVPAGAIIH
jgi:hypothetical protein